MSDSRLDEGSQKWNFSQNFLTGFQSSRLDLETRIEQATQSGAPVSKDVADSFLLDLAKLSKSVVDATGSIPTFDQRNCENQLKQIETTMEDLRKASAPKSKFTFKRKTKATPHSTAPSATPEIAPDPSPSMLSISSHSRKYITPADLPDSSTVAPELRSELSITDLDSCILNLIDSPQHEISALHIRNVKNSILLLPTLEGSVILHDLINCIAVVRCHQFRMHTSKSVDVYLSIQSNPSIEHSSDIRFAVYPALFAQPGVLENKNISVQDFSHIKATQSPNWRLLDEASSKTEEVWKMLSNIQDVEHVLRSLLPAESI